MSSSAPSTCPEATECTCAVNAVDYRGFVDLFIVISVGISSLVVLFRLIFRSSAAASTMPTASSLPRKSSGAAPVSSSASAIALRSASSVPNLGLSLSSSSATKRPSGSVKERLESEIRALLPRRSTYYAMPFFADTVANKQEFIESLIELGDGILDGWLLVKKGIQRGKNWKKRFVVLDGNGRIKYYPNADAARKNANIKGSLTVHAVKPADSMEFGANTLEVRGTLGGTYFFRTEGEMAARKWLCVLTKRAIQGSIPGRIDSNPGASLSSGSSGAGAGTGTGTGSGTDTGTLTGTGVSASGNGDATAAATLTALAAASPALKSHKLEAFVDDLTYSKEASLRQFYVVVKFKSELHDHSCVPVGQTGPKPCEKGVINWKEQLAWHFTDHQCSECDECQAIGSKTGTFKGLPDIMVLHVYEIHLRYLTTKIGQVALSLKEVFGFTGMQEASMVCKWPVLSSTDTVLGQLSLKLQYAVDLAGGAATVPFLVTTDTERELLGEYEIHPKIKTCIEFFELFYANGNAHRWQKYFKARGDMDVEIGEWGESSEYGGQVRVVSCRSLTNASIGPASTMTTQTQHIPFTELSLANPDKLVIETRVFLHDIPYGDCFTVEQVYVIERGASGNLVAKSSLGIPFSKGCMFKSKIISATREGVSQSTKLLFDELNKNMDADADGSGGANGGGGGNSSAVPVKPFLVSSEDDRHFLGQFDIHPAVRDPLHFFDLFFSNAAFAKWTPFFKDTGDADHQVTEWKDSIEFGGQVRNIKFRAQNTAPIGPPSTSANNDQHVKLPPKDDPDSDAPLVIESKMEMYDIPFGDCFTVETVHVVERPSGDAPHLVAKVYVGVPFLKSTMFKGKIVSGTRDGVAKTVAKTYEFLRKLMVEESEELAGSSGTARASLTETPKQPRAPQQRRVMLARLNSTLDGSVALEEIFENQRVSIFGKWGPNHLLPTDRERFTNRNGDVELSFEQIALPPHWTWTSPWRIDKSYTECDEEGWSYATDFPRFKSHLARGKSSNKRLGASVRRRRWIRIMAYVPPEGSAAAAAAAGATTDTTTGSPSSNAVTGDSGA